MRDPSRSPPFFFPRAAPRPASELFPSPCTGPPRPSDLPFSPRQAFVLTLLHVASCSSPEDPELLAAPHAESLDVREDDDPGLARGACVDGRNATGGPCAPPSSPQPRASPPNPGPRDLRWLLDVVDASPVPRRADWRSGLGFTAPVPPATDEGDAPLRDADPESFAAATMSQRRAAVAASARHAWRGYRQHAWPADELAPVSRRGVLAGSTSDSPSWIRTTRSSSWASTRKPPTRERGSPPPRSPSTRIKTPTCSRARFECWGVSCRRTPWAETPRMEICCAKRSDLAEKLAPAFQRRRRAYPSWTSTSRRGSASSEVDAEELAQRGGDARVGVGGARGGAAARRRTSPWGGDDEDERDADSGPGRRRRRRRRGGDVRILSRGRRAEGVRGAPRSVVRGRRSHSLARVVVERRRRPPSPLAGRWYRRDIASGARRAFVAVADAVWHPENDGLVPTAVSAGTAAFDRGSAVTLGAHGIRTTNISSNIGYTLGNPEGGEAAYLRAMDGVATHLLRRSGGDERREAAAEAAAEKRSAAAAAGKASVGTIERRRDGTATVSIASSPLVRRRPRRGPSRTARTLLAAARGPGLLYVAERRGGVDGEMSHKMDHLACFLPGTLALGYAEGLGERWGGGDDERERAVVRALRHLGFSGNATHLDVARELARTCACRCIARTPTGLAPEIAHFPLSGFGRRGGRGETTSRFGDLIVKENDAHNLLRPETVESLWMLWRVTGEREWRDAGCGDVARVGTTRSRWIPEGTRASSRCCAETAGRRTASTRWRVSGWERRSSTSTCSSPTIPRCCPRPASCSTPRRTPCRCSRTGVRSKRVRREGRARTRRDHRRETRDAAAVRVAADETKRARIHRASRTTVMRRCRRFNLIRSTRRGGGDWSSNDARDHRGALERGAISHGVGSVEEARGVRVYRGHRARGQDLLLGFLLLLGRRRGSRLIRLALERL